MLEALLFEKFYYVRNFIMWEALLDTLIPLLRMVKINNDNYYQFNHIHTWKLLSLLSFFIDNNNQLIININNILTILNIY